MSPKIVMLKEGRPKKYILYNSIYIHSKNANYSIAKQAIFVVFWGRMAGSVSKEGWVGRIMKGHMEALWGQV